MSQARQRSQMRLPPEVNRALYVRNLPFKITSDEMYDIFGKFGAIRQATLCPCPHRSFGHARARARAARAAVPPTGSQIRLGNAGDTRGTAFVVYEVRAASRTCAMRAALDPRPPCWHWR